MMSNAQNEQSTQLLKLPIVFSENAWQAMNLEGQATPAQMLLRRNVTVHIALMTIAHCALPEVQAFYEIEVPCDVTTGDSPEEHWLELRVVVVRQQEQPCGLRIMLRDEVHDPALRIPGIFFPPGCFVATNGVHALMEQGRLVASTYLNRHLVGDWGDVCNDDWQSNEHALEHGLRLFSAYKIDAAGEGKLWIITEADRSSTTLLLPSEY